MKWERKEGYVVQFLCREGHVLGLLKVKCVWYIVLRAIREMTKSRFLGTTKARSEYLMKKRRSLNKIKKEEQADARKKLEETIQQKSENWYQELAQQACDWVVAHWQRKFDFLKADIDDFDSMQPKIVDLACRFLMWYAARQDSAFVASKSSAASSVVKSPRLSSSFPLVWDDFIGSGVDESFLIRNIV